MKERKLGAYNSFVGAQESLLDSKNDKMQAADIKKARDRLDPTFKIIA